MIYKAIEHGKEHRKDYHIPLKWGGWCRSFFTHNPQKEDPWFAENRLHCNHKRLEAARSKLWEVVGYKPNSNKVKIYSNESFNEAV